MATRNSREVVDLEADPLEMRNVYNDPSYEEITVILKRDLLRLKREPGDTDDRFPGLMERNRSLW